MKLLYFNTERNSDIGFWVFIVCVFLIFLIGVFELDKKLEFALNVICIIAGLGLYFQLRWKVSQLIKKRFNYDI